MGRIVSKIGQAAGVKVHTDPRTNKVKYASAHDLRRSFGERWAARVMPQTLMELMRHESIETTLKFYVGHNAEKTAMHLHNAISGNTSGNTSHFPTSPPAHEKTEVTVRKRLPQEAPPGFEPGMADLQSAAKPPEPRGKRPSGETVSATVTA